MSNLGYVFTTQDDISKQITTRSVYYIRMSSKYAVCTLFMQIILYESFEKTQKRNKGELCANNVWKVENSFSMPARPAYARRNKTAGDCSR